jgi:hypothetical protein
MEKSEELRKQIQRLEIGGLSSSRGKTRSASGQKIPPKYRDPKNPSNVWAGRGGHTEMDGRENQDGAKREGLSDWVPRCYHSKKNGLKRKLRRSPRRGRGERQLLAAKSAATTNNAAANAARTE